MKRGGGGRKRQVVACSVGNEQLFEKRTAGVVGVLATSMISCPRRTSVHWSRVIRLPSTCVPLELVSTCTEKEAERGGERSGERGREREVGRDRDGGVRAPNASARVK